MEELPEVAFCICTYKRPWYAINTLQALIHKVAYAGKKIFHVADGGSRQEDMDYYRRILDGHDYSISVTSNLADMVNSCASVGTPMWLMTLDDFMPWRAFDITPDVRFLMNNPEVGAIRMGRLAFWEHGPDEQIVAELAMCGGLHWWVFDKRRTTHPYISSLNSCLYTRRYWDHYGDIPSVEADVPGQAEVELARAYNSKDGPTIAIPMRFGEDCLEWQEPFWHYGAWRTDEYALTGGRRL